MANEDKKIERLDFAGLKYYDSKLKEWAKENCVSWGKIVVPNIHIKGECSTNTIDYYWCVYFNGNKIPLDEVFDYKSNEYLKFGQRDDLQPWFGEGIKSLFVDIDTSQMTSMKAFFKGLIYIESLEIGKSFKTSHITDMTLMFQSCNLKTIDFLDRLDTRNVTSFGSMFDSAKLTEIDLSPLNTSSAKGFGGMFNYCYQLTTVKFGDKFDMRCSTGNTTKYYKMFYDCTRLTTVTGKIININENLELNKSPLTPDSAMVFINGLSEEVSGKTLTFSSTTYDSLTPEQIAVGTAKGWSIVKS